MAKRKFGRNILISVISVIVVAIIVSYYIYLIRTGEAQIWLRTIQSLGYTGILVGILIQAFVNIIPVPGEIVSLALMEIYGPFWGGVYTWIGGIIGAVAALNITKWIAKPYFEKKAQPFLHKVDAFLKDHEMMGLLFIRFVPLVPYHMINYVAGLLDVKIWYFVWTTALGILPFTIIMSGIYAGVRHGSIIWGIIGGVISLLLIIIGWASRKPSKNIQEGE